MKKIKIHTDFITLGQFLKIADIIATGGMAKMFLNSDVSILINGEYDKRRGRKLRNGDVIKVDADEFVLVKEDVD